MSQVISNAGGGIKTRVFTASTVNVTAIQLITLSRSSNASGSFSLNFDGDVASAIPGAVNDAAFAAVLETAIQSLTGLEDATVAVTGEEDVDHTFLVTMTGTLGPQNLITVSNNTLNDEGTPVVITITTDTVGVDGGFPVPGGTSFVIIEGRGGSGGGGGGSRVESVGAHGAGGAGCMSQTRMNAVTPGHSIQIQVGAAGAGGAQGGSGNPGAAGGEGGDTILVDQMTDTELFRWRGGHGGQGGNTVAAANSGGVALPGQGGSGGSRAASSFTGTAGENTVYAQAGTIGADSVPSGGAGDGPGGDGHAFGDGAGGNGTAGGGGAGGHGRVTVIAATNGGSGTAGYARFTWSTVAPTVT